MCGILSFTGPTACQGFPEALALYSRRGPDAQGIHESPGGRCILGHRRLSIIDLSDAGNQPMHNEDGKLSLVCNGEIYNYPTLRRKLELQGHVFSSDSDSEIILHGYEEWGVEVVTHLLGMFAFVLWDDRLQRVFAARDHVGIKPLSFFHEGETLIIASDTRAIVRMRPDLQLNPLALSRIITLGYIPAPESIWRGVCKLEPGHRLSFQDDRLEISKWWEPPRAIDSGLDPEDFSALFDEVVSDHLLADRPVGLLLSGGLDSTAVGLAACRTGNRPAAFTVSYPDSVNNELPIAMRVAAQLGLEHHALELTLNTVNDLLNEVLTEFDEPQGYSALLSMLGICEAASRDRNVVLAGDGGDEVFTGYNWYAPSYPNGTGRAQWQETLEQDRNGQLTDTTGLWRTFSNASPLHAHAARLFPRFLPHEAKALLRLETPFDDEVMLAPLSRHFEPRLPVQRAMQRVDLMTFCTDSILAKVDRASMAHSLEVRVPFLDRRIIEFGMQLPIQPGQKHTTKQYLKRHGIPNEVINHPKQGFSLRCLSNMDWGKMAEGLTGGYLVESGILNRDALGMALRPPYSPAKIWVLNILDKWARKWVQ